MANPTLNDGTNTLTFKPGNFIVRPTDSVRQRRLVSSDGTVRVIENSTTDGEELEIEVVALPTSDVGSFSGRDSLRTSITSTLNWAESTATITDTDGDSWTARYWMDEFPLKERKQDEWHGRLRFRVEV